MFGSLLVQKEGYYFDLLRPSEDKFIWKENKRNIEIIFAKPREIYNCDWNLFAKIDESQLIKKIDNQELSKENWYIDVFKHSNESTKHYFLKQTNIGDCFLVSSIISLINMPGILYELFYFNNNKDKNYTDKNEEINLYYYDYRHKNLVNIKNTYPTFKNQKDKEQYLQKYSKRFASNFISPIPFTTSRNGILLGQALIKAFICVSYLKELTPNAYKERAEIIPIENLINSNLKILEDKDKTILIFYYENYKMSKAYEFLNEGGNPETAMNIFLGCNTEIFFDSDKFRTFGFQDEIIKKIKKYIQLGGFIQVSHVSHGAHSYSLLNYLEIKENGKTDIYFSILNPNRDHTDYIYEGIDSITENNMTHLPDFRKMKI